MLEFFRHLFSIDPFMPHGMCFLWDPTVLWLHVISDLLIAIAYYAIPVLLFYFSRRRRDIPFNWIFVAFAGFILACGTTHLLAAITVWQPVYRLDGVVKAITAIASIATSAMLVPLMPTLISLPSPSQLARVNHALEDEIAERRVAESAVREINEELEKRVASRTAALEQALEEGRNQMKQRRNLEDQLIHSQKMEAVGRLAGGVAHDFNNLLTVILGYNEMLREHCKEDPIAMEYAHEVLQASERAASLTNQLLAFSRRQVAVRQIVDLNHLVGQIDRMLRRIIGEDIELDLRLDPALPPVHVDPTHVDQVIMNLVVNSRDAMPHGGTLTIETSTMQLNEEYTADHLELQPGQYVVLAVTDTGTGMDAATRSHIFEPFFTTKEKGKGTGLGLSIVYGIVKQNGGEVLVYSEPGQGTVFRIYLPVAAAPSEGAPPTLDVDEDAPSTGAILLVEDEDQVRSLARAILARLGYTVRDFSSPTDALQFLHDHPEPFDLLLTDIVMPKMSGMELAAEVQASRPNMRVLFMSGYTDAGVAGQKLITADTPFIQKPFTSDVLKRKVREMLGGE